MWNEDGRIVETAAEARGGFLGRPVLLVLIASTSSSVVQETWKPRISAARSPGRDGGDSTRVAMGAILRSRSHGVTPLRQDVTDSDEARRGCPGGS